MATMLIALRATHDRLGLDALERVTRGADQLDTIIDRLNQAHSEQPLSGWVSMSTCNRLEIYLDADLFHEAVELVAQAVSEASGLAQSEVEELLVADAGSLSAQHMFTVAAGLNSQVVGEGEINGQVRASFSEALAEGRTTSMLNDLFQGALRTAKNISHRTTIGAAGRSSVTVAIDQAEPTTGSLTGARVIVVGTGAMARIAASDLNRRGVARLDVLSGSGRAKNFATTHNAHPLATDEMPAALAASSLVVACSGRGTAQILTQDVRDAMQLRELYNAEHVSAKLGELVILDMSLTSDLEEGVRSIPGVRVLGLKDISADASDQEEIERAQDMINAGVGRFELRQQIRRLDPAVSALRRSVRSEIEREIEGVRNNHDEETVKVVERALGRVYKRLLHSPMMRAQELAKEGEGQKFMSAVHTLFGVDLEQGGQVPNDPVSIEARQTLREVSEEDHNGPAQAMPLSEIREAFVDYEETASVIEEELKEKR